MCIKCGECCKDIIIPLGVYVDDDKQKWLEYHGIEVIKGNPITSIRLTLKCQNLVDNKCSIHKDRPQVCKDYQCK